MELYKKFLEISIPSQAYSIAALAGFLGLVLGLDTFAISQRYSVAAFGFSTVCFAFGFMAWSVPRLRRAWEHWFWRRVIFILNVFVLLLSTALSRKIVAAAIGLPPQDFDLSVGFVALAMYPLAWCFVIVVPLGLLAVLFQFGAFIMSALRSRTNWHALRQMGHGLGAFAVVVALAYIADGYLALQKHAYPLIRWIAVFSDYQIAPGYPGALPNERIRLHENGIISFPAVENGTLVIKTRKYEGS